MSWMGFRPPKVNEGEGEVVAGDQTTDGKNDVADGDVVQVLVNCDQGLLGGAGTETNGGKDGGGVKTETVEGNVEGKPRPGGTKEDLAVLPLTKVVGEVSPGSLRDLGTLVVVDGVDDIGAGGKIRVDILRGLLDVALDVHGVAGSLGDGETEV